MFAFRGGYPESPRGALRETGLSQPTGSFRRVPEPSATMTVHLNKSEPPLTRLAALCLFLKVYDPGFANQTSKALPGAVQSKAFLSFHLTPSGNPS